MGNLLLPFLSSVRNRCPGERGSRFEDFFREYQEEFLYPATQHTFMGG